jgi:hypothetical protein
MSDTPWIRAIQDACPNAAEHTYGPRGYLAWHEWAQKAVKTHTVRRCPGCGYWLIYRRRVKAEAVPS